MNTVVAASTARGDRHPVVVTGAAVLSPLAEDLPAFATALLAGRSAVTLPPSPDPSADLDEQPLPGALLSDFHLAQWAERHLPDDPETATRLRRVTGRAALPARTAGCVALLAARDARLPVGPAPDAWGPRAAVVVAGSNLALAHQAATVLGHHATASRLLASYALTHLDVDVVGAVSELTGITGEGWAVGGASASGTIALIQAARMVAADWVDRVLVVAPVAELSPAEEEAYRRTGAMAHQRFRDNPERMCRPFDRDRHGFVRGEAAAAVVLERPEAAAARGAAALAEVAGYGQRLDARRGTEPDAYGQEAAMRAALTSAGVGPGDVDYVSAHGTGSVLGDLTEAAALRQVFGERGSPLINSTKPLVGHCLSAAGLVEAVAVILQLRAGACHPNPNLDHSIEPALGLVGPAAVHRPLRTALSNSFAFGGINTSIVLRLPDGGRAAGTAPTRES